MKLKIVFLYILLSVNNIAPMLFTHTQENILDIDGIIRELPNDFRYFIFNLKYGTWGRAKRHLLLVAKDSMDAKKVAQKIASSYEMAFISVDAEKDVFLKKNCDYEEIFHKAQDLAKRQFGRALIFVQNAEFLIDKDLMYNFNTGSQKASLARAFMKYDDDKDIAVIVHCRELGVIEHELRYYFYFDAKIESPDRLYQKLIIQKHFRENNITIDDKMLNYLVNYIRNKNWSETNHIAQALVETTKECKTNIINPSIIRMCLQDFKTPLEKIQDCVTSGLRVVNKVLQNEYLLVASGAITFYVFVPQIIKKIKSKHSRYFREI
jgi:hypothetical protein